MKKIFIAALICLMAATLCACVPLALLAADGITGPDNGDRNAPEDSTIPGGGEDITGNDAYYEALDWLSENDNISAFAGNRFDGTEEAVDFVKNLYAAGAVTVWVTGIYDEKKRIQEEGGPYADTLIVQLPDDSARREKIKSIYRREVQMYACNDGVEEAGYQGDLLSFWWD